MLCNQFMSTLWLHHESMKMAISLILEAPQKYQGLGNIIPDVLELAVSATVHMLMIELELLAHNHIQSIAPPNQKTLPK